MDQADIITHLDKLENTVLAGLQEIRSIKEEIQNSAIPQNDHEQEKLLGAKELAEHLNVDVSWVYEQSRQGNIPTIRIGRYIRFNLQEVLASQQENGRS